MKPYALALLAIVGLTSLGIFLIARKSVAPAGGPVIVAPPPKIAPPTVPTLEPPAPAHEAARRQAATTASRPPATTPQAVGSPNATDAATLAIAEADSNNGAGPDPVATGKALIQSLVAANNPGNVPAIARYLEHDNAELRQEAVLGLLALGEKSGAPFLIAATVKARTPEEADAFKEAADFLTKGVKDTTLPPPPPPPGDEASPADLAR